MVSSSVSNTILVEAVFGLVFVLTASVLMDGPSWRKTIMLGLVLGAGLLTSVTCLILFGVAFLIYAVVWRRGGLSLREAATHMTAAVIIAAVIGGWWLARNQVMYGDPLAGAKFAKVFSDLPGPRELLTFNWTVNIYIVTVIQWTFASFWGCFGYMDVFMPVWSYLMLAIATILVSISFLRQLAARKLPMDGSVAAIYALTFLAVLAAFVFFNTKWLQAQGRYLYPALMPISVFWVIGMGSFAPKSQVLKTLLVVSLPLGAQVIALVTCIVPEMPYYF
jgi:hypothetical protein